MRIYSLSGGAWETSGTCVIGGLAGYATRFSVDRISPVLLRSGGVSFFTKPVLLIMASTSRSAFHSARLRFRELRDNDEDKTFVFDAILSDPESWALSNPGLLRPPQRSACNEMVTHLATKAFLAVMICLPAGKTGEEKPLGVDKSIGFHSARRKHQPVARPSPEDRTGHMHRSRTPGQRIRRRGPSIGLWIGPSDMRTCIRVSLGTFSYNARSVYLYQKLRV